MHALAGQASRFLIVGGICTVVNYGVFVLLERVVGMPYLLASATGYLIGLVIGYLLNRNWTFRAHKATSGHAKEVSLYGAVYAVSLVLSLTSLRIMVEGLHWLPLIANVFAIGLSTITNFVGLKLVVFTKPSNNSLNV